MSDLAITAATAILGSNTASGDLFPVVDVSASTPKGRSITRDELGTAMVATSALTTALDGKLDKAGGTMTGALTLNLGALTTAGITHQQTWNSAGTTCRGLEVKVTNTNSAAASSYLRVCGGASGTTEYFGINAAGWITGPASGTMVIAPAAGNNLNLYVTGGGNITTNASVACNGGITMQDGQHITTGTSSGMKLGTATTQKLAFWNATPVVQQVLPTGSTTDQVITLLQTLGLCRQS